MPVEPPLPIRKSDRPPLPYRRPLPSSMKSMDTPAAGSVYKYNPLSLPSLDPRVVTAGQNADGAASNSVNKPLPITRRDSHARFAEKPTETPSTGIATKQRLANFALQPIAPKQVGTLSSAKTPTLSGFPSGHPAFSQSGFKKNLPPQETHTLASLNSAPDSPLHVPAENARDFSKPEFHRRHTHSNSTGSASMADADAFLQTLMPKTLAEPFSEIQMDVDEEPMPPLPQRGPPQKKLKAWTWTGLLLVKAGGQDVPREFSILIDEELELQRTGFKFSVLFGNVKNLCINSLYDVQDLPLLLRACKPPAYRARMSLQAESEDAVSNHWATFVQYMSKRKKVAAIALMLDEHVVAHLLLYPASSHVLPAEIPPVTLKGHTLVAVILPWSLTQGEIAADPRQGRTSATRDISLQTHIKPLAKGYQEIERGHLEASTPHWDNLVKTRHLFQLAIRVLGFPSKIYEFLKLTSRRWAVCSAKGNSRNRLDVQLLRTILNRIMQESRAAPGSSHQPKIKGITHTSDPTDAGILFLHASTLHDLDNLPFLPAILLASNYVRVYMFGTDPSFPNISGVREILPCGGIVTLTPGAILNHPLQTMRLLKEISEHPLWMAYVLPSVIGFVAEVCRAKSGSIQNFPIPFLLNAIASGNLASIQAPPPAKAWYGKTDQRPAWVRENLSGKSMTQLEALTRATATFHTKYANADPESWEARIKEEVVEDLKQMQRQPVLLEGYRRFVVLGDGRMENRGSVSAWVMMSTDILTV
ncbi:hypothetical protein FA15DRAFT_662665 [Coprinopsis marcescibilis]|uniref:Uncharacterized protein n=1 Tax=Coprinopsis marcescibilis TaxID=230819 RepID=A0A5C3LCZ5_COPMA|nr:hypothetical protein FA15DRAFT_662665 [Coprinopsis marcescibilis]